MSDTTQWGSTPHQHTQQPSRKTTERRLDSSPHTEDEQHREMGNRQSGEVERLSEGRMR